MYSLYLFANKATIMYTYLYNVRIKFPSVRSKTRTTIPSDFSSNRLFPHIHKINQQILYEAQPHSGWPFLSIVYVHRFYPTPSSKIVRKKWNQKLFYTLMYLYIQVYVWCTFGQGYMNIFPHLQAIYTI